MQQLIAELDEEFTTLPAMVTGKIGWGAGYKDLKIPNVLKVYYGETFVYPEYERKIKWQKSKDFQKLDIRVGTIVEASKWKQTWLNAYNECNYK